MKLTWYGHSCFLVESAEGSAVLDPYTPGSVPGLTLPALCADAVICSHGHKDHCCAEAVRLSGEAPRFGRQSLETFHDGEGGLRRGKNTVTLIETEGLRLVHLGDLGHMLSAGQLAALGRVDVLLVPIGGFYTIDAKQAHELAVKLNAKIVIPMHYRGDGFGYDVISTADEFIALSDNVTYFKSSSLELSPIAEPMTAILAAP